MAHKISLIGIRVAHPGRGEPSRIELNIALDYLAAIPIATVVLDPKDALRLIEDAARAIRVTEPSEDPR